MSTKKNTSDNTINISVSNNFANIFAQFDDVQTIKAIANQICAQVNEAYHKRWREIHAKDVTPVAVEIEVSENDNAPKQTAQSKKGKNKSEAVVEKAKEVAEKLKEKASTKTKSKSSAKDDDAEIDIADTAAVKKLGLKFEKYNDRCWVLRGNTKPIRKELKEFGGVFNSRLAGGEGWVFRTAKAQGVASVLGIKAKIA